MLEELVCHRTAELQRANEELRSHEEAIRHHNRELNEARQIIERQNERILIRNESLEEEVTKRTTDVVKHNERLEEFAFIAAHYLRAPVARILGLGNILEATRRNPEETFNIVDKVISTTKELDSVVKDLMTVLRVRNTNTSFIKELNLNHELALVLNNLSGEIEETQAECVVDFSRLENIRTLPSYLHSILTKLISNAIKYRHPDRRPIIRIQSHLEGNYVCLSVSDNGLGIDLTLFRDKLFMLYNRFHLHVEGKGMGLYIVKTQLDTLGGKIEVESEVGQGTSFKVYFKNMRNGFHKEMNGNAVTKINQR
jgi:signal transduction histidine kinase